MISCVYDFDRFLWKLLLVYRPQHALFLLNFYILETIRKYIIRYICSIWWKEGIKFITLSLFFVISVTKVVLTLATLLPHPSLRLLSSWLYLWIKLIWFVKCLWQIFESKLIIMIFRYLIRGFVMLHLTGIDELHCSFFFRLDLLHVTYIIYIKLTSGDIHLSN